MVVFSLPAPDGIPENSIMWHVLYVNVVNAVKFKTSGHIFVHEVQCLCWGIITFKEFGWNIDACITNGNIQSDVSLLKNLHQMQENWLTLMANGCLADIDYP